MPHHQLILANECLSQSHGCTPRRAMEMKAARGEAEERQDAARAREEKLRRLKGEAIRESYLEGKKVGSETSSYYSYYLLAH